MRLLPSHQALGSGFQKPLRLYLGKDDGRARRRRRPAAAALAQLQLPRPLLLLLLLLLQARPAPAADTSPPPPTANALQRLWEEIGNVKSMMAIISEELSRFNTLYLGKLEHRMLAIATALSSVDSNVKNLQERAHVWDTFQLHVAAWNEQIKTLDKKVDILNRGQEKLELMDGKLNSLLSLDYKVERVAGKIAETDNKVSALGRSVESRREAAPAGYPLFGDVATRGVLSTLRVIERKLDRVGAAAAAAAHRGGRMHPRPHPHPHPAPDTEETVAGLGRGKLVIRCNAPVAMEEMVRDVASKVDVMFDKMAAAAEAGEPASGPAGQQLEPPPAGAGELRELAEHRLMDRLWKRLTSPYKKTARALEGLEVAVLGVGNASAAAWEEQAAAAARALACCEASGRRLRQLVDEREAGERRLSDGLAAAARQSRLLGERLDRLETACSGSGGGGGAVWTRGQSDAPAQPEGSGDDEEAAGPGPAPGTGVEPPFIPVLAPAGARGCEDLRPARHSSAVYRLAAREPNARGRDFHTRFCDMRTDGGGWTVIQRRGNYPNPQQNFTLSWNDYKHGFGDLDKEFWFGNDFIHRLTYQKEMILRVDLISFSGEKAWAEYSIFRVSSDDSLYRLTVGGYSGNASNSLQVHNGAYFSTSDRKNDEAPPCCPCAESYGGGWWFDSCFEANLNGVYFRPRDQRDVFRGIIWEKWLGDESLMATEMKIRPRNLSVPNTREDPGFDEHNTADADDVDPLGIPEDP